MRVVIDVNVWVSGILWGGAPGQVLTMAYAQQITSCVSNELLLELKTTLERKKFSDRLQLRNLTPARAVAIAQAVSEIVDPTTVSVPELRDPADLKITATAIASRATNLPHHWRSRSSRTQDASKHSNRNAQPVSYGTARVRQ